ncbi:hypothetical protein UAW_00073 [Enterococcus haemoperoxidus ATCC BAA-382]|uniref:Uncharacterized protein n=1 Tax=Enterococcus haemoperoxidus ATCC BAA-382 TaxID=1158608 RepID=R2QZI6_9ENTE|nr:hypothetical protein [Enterococcus haemoperoxidus]EOI00806.1 hypothetical protein UAW_00073 [Enterococcus haemoperoxidus ATCC BAA-382]EOT62040.1 hypothetical protein I583_01040 [Enterococcus haemoperoxidus ATCC BAA-382]OJG52065.1 hypothetical protein RV06_GL001080 [Enterococcus haemoperoxidus]
MKDKKNYYQKYRYYYLGEIVLLIGWITNTLLFSRFYEEAIFYVDKKDKYIIQLLFLVNYYLDDLLKYLFVAFLLMTLNLFLILRFYIKNRREVTKRKEMQYSMIVFLVLIGFNIIALLTTIVWPLFLLLFIVSMTIVYIIYVITKYLYEEKDERYEENELVKVGGPFQTKEAAERYANEFLAHWKNHFAKNGYILVDNLTCHDKTKWQVEIIVQSIK